MSYSHMRKHCLYRVEFQGITFREIVNTRKLYVQSYRNFSISYTIKLLYSKCSVCILAWLPDTKCRLSNFRTRCCRIYIYIQFPTVYTFILNVTPFSVQPGFIHASSNISQMYIDKHHLYTGNKESARRRSTVKKRAAIIPSVFTMCC